MEMPPELLPVGIYESRRVKWFFGSTAKDKLRQRLKSFQCSAEQISALLESTNCQIIGSGVLVEPPDKVVRSLLPGTRSQLYGFLASFQENEAQRDPFHWPRNDQESLFAASALTPDSRQLFERLCYVTNSSILFADLPVLLRSIPEPSQRIAIVKMLSRRKVVFASLKVSPETDLNALMDYWGVGGFAKDVRPVLQAAVSLPSTRQISLAALMPPAPRALLFTFPLPGGGVRPNCHWTAFNFFSEVPDAATTDEAVWLQKLQRDYVRVQESARYGDIVVLERPDGELLHSCVYLADDLLYSKNGVSHWAPWQITTLKDLLEYYSWNLPSHQQLRVSCYRPRRFLRS